MKLSHFFKPTKSLIGLEFSNHSIQWAELAYINHAYTLQSYAQTPISLTNILSPTKQEQIELAQKLKQTKARLNPHTHNVCLSIDFSAVLFKTIELDNRLTSTEILCYIRQEAEKYFNFPPNELMLDFKILNPSLNHPGLVTIQWVAARRRDLTIWLNIIKQAELKPAVADINSHALQRSAALMLKFTDNSQTQAAAIHLLPQSFLLVIFNQAQQSLVRSERFTMDNSILECIHRCLKLCLVHTQTPISHILLSGPLASNELTLELQKKTNIQTALFNPFPQIPQAHNFAMSIGLAMRVQNVF